jgi:hypothetical protein
MKYMNKLLLLSLVLLSGCGGGGDSSGDVSDSSVNAIVSGDLGPVTQLSVEELKEKLLNVVVESSDSFVDVRLSIKNELSGPVRVVLKYDDKEIVKEIFSIQLDEKQYLSNIEIPSIPSGVDKLMVEWYYDSNWYIEQETFPNGDVDFTIDCPSNLNSSNLKKPSNLTEEQYQKMDEDYFTCENHL